MQNSSKDLSSSSHSKLNNDILQKKSEQDYLGSYITDPILENKLLNLDEKSNQQKTKKHIYNVDLAEPPFDKNVEYAELPDKVEFSRLVANIINALKVKKSEDLQYNQNLSTNCMSLKQVSKQPKSQGDKNLATQASAKHHGNSQQLDFKRWEKYLNLQENRAIISDGFWYSICLFKQKKFEKYQQLSEDEKAQKDQKEKMAYDHQHYEMVKTIYLERIARNYVNLLLSIEDPLDNKQFFHKYFNIIAQAVFYSFYYSFPYSRSQFNDELKKDLIDQFSYLFTGIHISNCQQYYSKWNLDLGAGNVLEKQKNQYIQRESKKEEEKDIRLPQLLATTKTYKRNPRRQMPVRFSPILWLYITKYKYSTRNTIPPYKMKFTEYDKKSTQIEKKFQFYQNYSVQIWKEAQEMKQESEKQKTLLQQEIHKLKEETIAHHKRLEKRKAEELERGAHEYANYLVSMLNAGLNMANLGVSNQRGNM